MNDRLPAQRTPVVRPAPGRSSDQIRADIERTREELGTSVEQLRWKVTELTDWRRQLHEHKRAVMVGVGIAGFVVGGGLAALTARRRR